MLNKLFSGNGEKLLTGGVRGWLDIPTFNSTWVSSKLILSDNKQVKIEKIQTSNETSIPCNCIHSVAK